MKLDDETGGVEDAIVVNHMVGIARGCSRVVCTMSRMLKSYSKCTVLNLRHLCRSRDGQP